MDWTEQQQKAIGDRDSSLLVSAAAGSGKTAVLVERIRRLIMDEGVGIDRMLVVTFTRAAAGEMKEKIYKSLSKALSAETGKARRAELRHQISLIGRSDICTFDQFALRVVHRYYHIAGLAPGIGVCDEGSGAIMRREAMDEMFEALFAAADTDFLAFLTRYCSSRDNEAARSMIFDCYDFLCSLPNPVAWMDAVCSDDFDFTPVMEFARSRALMFLNLALRNLDAAGDLLDDSSLKRFKEFIINERELVSSAIAALESDNPDFAVIGTIAWGRMLTARKDEKPKYELVKDAVKYYRDAAKALYKDNCLPYAVLSAELLAKEREAALPFIRVLCRLTKDFSERYMEKKLKRGVLDFSDIAHAALDILDNELAASEYREKFKYVFVDEYQDSNLVQDGLIQKISRPDNCFMVGDVKQSIYKFRQAEPELFLEKYGAFKAGLAAGVLEGRVIDLNKNFRSSQAVIEIVNRLFSALMSPGSAGMEYDDAAALVKGRASDESEGIAELWIADSGADEDMDEEIKELKAAELEALQAVKIIKAYQGIKIQDADGEKPEQRLRYRDMVILMRGAKNRAEVFYKTLSGAGIPVLLERGEGYFDTIEISVFLSLLRLIDNARQDIPLLSVLHFPSFGFSAEELAAVRIFADAELEGRVSYNEAFLHYAGEGPKEELRQKCREFLERLSDWRFRALHTPLGDFLWELLCTTGIGDFSASVPGGEQRRANLLLLVTKAEEYEARSAGGLHAFISYIEMLTAKGGSVDIGQARVLSEGSDAVRIMTIHKSKGLEFPFVLVAGLGSRRESDRSGNKLTFHREFGVGMRIINPVSGFHYDTIIQKIIADRKKADALAEEIRILYVALTRARDILILSALAKNAEDRLNAPGLAGDVWSVSNYLDMILPLMRRSEIRITSRSELAALMRRVKANRSELAESLDRGFEYSEDSGISDEELSERLNFACAREEGDARRKYSVSELAAMMKEKSSFGIRRIVREDADAMDESELSVDASGLSAAERGTAYHRVMEEIDFASAEKDAPAVARLIERMRGRNILGDAEAAAVDPQKIAGFFSSETGRRACAAKEIMKEAPFTLKTEYEGREILVQGTIDCCFKENGNWVLVDYKNSRVSGSAAAIKAFKEAYIPQLSLYKKALEEIMGSPVSECCLYLFETGEAIKINQQEIDAAAKP